MEPRSSSDWALLKLARRDKADFEQTMHAVTEAGATTLKVARCSVWRLVPGRTALVCEDLYQPALGRHSRGGKVYVDETPAYFSALFESRAIPADDARTDPRTADLGSYLGPLGITSMMDVPIWHRGDLYGVLCNEHVGPPRQWQPEEVSFAGNLADVLSLSLEAAERVTTERRWQAVVGAIAEAVVVMDETQNIVLSNPAAEEMLARFGGGISPQERLRLMEYRDLHGDPLPADKWPFARAWRGEVIRGEIVAILARRTGKVHYFRISSAPFFNGGTRVTSTVSIFSDVSQEVEIDRLKREFLAALAHELKTPVAITKGYAQMLELALPVPEKSRPMLEAIGRASDRLQSLIADLMDIASIAQGKLALQRERVDLSDIARTALKRVQAAAPTHRLLVVAMEAAYVLVDRPRVEHVVRQLVENAVRYSPGQRSVEIEVCREGSSALLRVRDSGIGIPAERQKHIFEPFYRAHAGTPYDFGGVGIGLYLARQIAVAHGGDIEFESSEGKGSTFELRLPLAQGNGP